MRNSHSTNGYAPSRRLSKTAREIGAERGVPQKARRRCSNYIEPLLRNNEVMRQFIEPRTQFAEAISLERADLHSTRTIYGSTKIRAVRNAFQPMELR